MHDVGVSLIFYQEPGMDQHFEEVPKERGGSTVGMNSHRWYWSDTE